MTRFTHFFIDRPIFASVLSILIVLVGGLASLALPIAQYPEIAPPNVVVRATYPGANAKVLAETVATPIEQEVNGVEDMLYMSSQSTNDGVMQLTITFKPGTDLDKSQVLVQNRVALAEPRLPEEVRRQGITVRKRSPDLSLVVNLISPDGRYDSVYLSNYALLQIRDVLARLPGVGDIVLFGGREYSMRIWLDPEKVAARNLTSTDVVQAIREQNIQVAAGVVGQPPTPGGIEFQLTVTTMGRLTDESQFGDIIIKTGKDGQVTRLKDVARIELGAKDYSSSLNLDGKATVGVAIFQLPGSNAIETKKAVVEAMEKLKQRFPEGLDYLLVYDTVVFVTQSIAAVVETLFEAILLVVVVVLIFLQNWRATIIPLLAVPVSLIGTFAVMAAMGLSLNTLSLFGLVLAIGIVVDDAIVVVENVERIMAEEGLPPKEATRKAMSQITGAIIGITLVLMAVFVPMAFFPGSVGIIYRQFSVTMVAAIGFSAFLALSLTPALCATLLKPIAKGHGHSSNFVFGWFNHMLEAARFRYAGTVGFSLKRTGRLMLVYAALLVGLSWAFVSLPGGFLPVDDQGFVTTDVQTPSDSSYARTEAVIEKVEKYLAARPGVKDVTFLTGFSFSGQGMNTAQAFITLKDWSERGPADSAAAIVNDINRDLSSIRDAKISALQPPPIDNLGNSSGFSFRLQDRGQKGYSALMRAADQLIAAANASPVLQKVYIEGLPEAGVVNLMIDREKAGAFGVTFEDINNTISTNLGSNYINDFPNRGRMQRVVVQADARDRMRTEDILNYNVKNSRGQLVPFSSFATVEWARGPTQIAGFNYYPAVRISGEARPGFTSGDAIAEMEQLADRLPRGFGYEWTGQSLQEKLSGSQAPFLLALSVFVVFLCLAALYESWTIPLAVLLTVPLGIVGAVAAAMLRGLPNDVYFTVGLITIIGLAAKDAILIIEFAKDLRKEGKPLVEATIEACRLRFRPILMTGLAFICGVLPMAIAHGAGGASQQALGSIVMGGMIAVVILALLMVPVFFVSVQRVLGGDREPAAAKDHEAYGPPARARAGH